MAKWGVIDGSRVTGALMQSSEDLTHYLLDDKHHCYKIWLRSVALSLRTSYLLFCLICMAFFMILGFLA